MYGIQSTKPQEYNNIFKNINTGFNSNYVDPSPINNFNNFNNFNSKYVDPSPPVNIFNNKYADPSQSVNIFNNKYVEPSQPMNNFNGNNIQNQHVDQLIASMNKFLIEYYGIISIIGWNGAMYLFDKQCVVIYKDKNVGNSYNFLNILSSEYIKRANYNSLKFKWVSINSNISLINVFGYIQFVGYSGYQTNIVPFTESFVMSAINGNIICTHHMFDF